MDRSEEPGNKPEQDCRVHGPGEGGLQQAAGGGLLRLIPRPLPQRPGLLVLLDLHDERPRQKHRLVSGGLYIYTVDVQCRYRVMVSF